jgi:hypothetical protein
MKSFRKSLFVRVVMFLLTLAMPSPQLARAQASATGGFQLSRETHWGGAVLPAGSYEFSLESATPGAPVVIRQISGGFVGVFLPQTVVPDGTSDNSRLELVRRGEETFVSSLYVKGLGSALKFVIPKADAGVEGSSSRGLGPPPSVPAALVQVANAFFTIRNPKGQAWPSAEAEIVYLSACKVIEREFSSPTSLRPQFTLSLGASRNTLSYSEHEIQLTKWDKYRFAQGVLVLAFDELLSPKQRLELARAALSEADSSVDVNALRKEGLK